MSLVEIIENKIFYLRKNEDSNYLINGEILFNNGACQILTQSAVAFEFYISSEFENSEVKLVIEDNQIYPVKNKEIIDWNENSYASLLQLHEELKQNGAKEEIRHKKYSREGMIKRVMTERMQKAEKAEYRIEWADNIYGDHILTNERGIRYKIFLRDFEKQIGYSDSMDAKINKLGTTKHIMYAFKKLKEYPNLYHKLSKRFPFVEIYLDPLNEYRISWYYPYELPVVHKLLISKYFGNNNYIPDEKATRFIGFIDEAENIKEFVIRPEVLEKIERLHENKVLEKVSRNIQFDYGQIKLKLFDYQKEGIEFAVSKKASIIADEMGLGKTVQAIATAVFKKEIFGFTKCLIVCPASIKYQWKSEIEKFTAEKAVVVQGFPEERQKIYADSDAYFMIVNYETVLRDHLAINKAGIDFLILDEAQRVKNYATKTAQSIKNIGKKHVMVITGTPIENKLLDLFSIMSVIDPWFLGPLWEFSYQYCLFDPEKHNKINGYYNLSQLKEQIKPILLRREKRKVIEQLPNIQQIDVPITMSPEQMDYHLSYSKGVAQILRKKFITPFDMQRMMLLLTNMRMVCNSTYLIDQETNHSPKLDELKYILLEKLDIKNTDRKIIIFSEWVKMHQLIAKMLRENNIGFVELNGSVPVKLRGELIRKFENNKDSKIFLSTEAGGVGLNLQVADTVINFELPWNPAKKNQRIGRIDRLGQESAQLTVLNFITRNSIEMKIASGLLLKQNLFDGVLNQGDDTDIVDFTEKGRAQFLDDIRAMVHEFELTEFVNEQAEVLDHIEEIGKTDKTNTVDKNKLKDETEEKNNSIADKQKEEKNISEKEELADEMEEVLNQGLAFISGIFKMATGKDLSAENQKIEVNKKTGEVIMKFKLPGF